MAEAKAEAEDEAEADGGAKAEGVRLSSAQLKPALLSSARLSAVELGAAQPSSARDRLQLAGTVVRSTHLRRIAGTRQRIPGRACTRADRTHTYMCNDHAQLSLLIDARMGRATFDCAPLAWDHGTGRSGCSKHFQTYSLSTNGYFTYSLCITLQRS